MVHEGLHGSKRRAMASGCGWEKIPLELQGARCVDEGTVCENGRGFLFSAPDVTLRVNFKNSVTWGIFPAHLPHSILIKWTLFPFESSWSPKEILPYLYLLSQNTETLHLWCALRKKWKLCWWGVFRVSHHHTSFFLLLLRKKAVTLILVKVKKEPNILLFKEGIVGL